MFIAPGRNWSRSGPCYLPPFGIRIGRPWLLVVDDHPVKRRLTENRARRSRDGLPYACNSCFDERHPPCVLRSRTVIAEQIGEVG